jgi:hypothetical protein
MTLEEQQTLEATRNANLVALETDRAAANAAADAKRAKLELVRIAKEILTQNSLSQPVESRAVSAADITAMADTLNTYVNS